MNSTSYVAEESTMAESLHRSSDTPNFDTYPDSPSGGQIGRSDAAGISNEPFSQRTGHEPSSLEQHAAELGAAAGKVVVIMRQTKENLEHLTQHAIYDRLTVLAENAKVRAEQLARVAGARVQEYRQSAQVKAAELGRNAREKSGNLARQAKTGYASARRRADQTVQEYPVHVALAAGAVGFLIGVALRVRRAKRAY
jgi:ElaB/YqjD/DUF883 family membrane-anchored ribosome-binding protein